MTPVSLNKPAPGVGVKRCGRLSILALAIFFVSSSFAHGRPHDLLILDVGVDDTQLTVNVDSPLDSLLGFGKSPTSQVQKEASVAFLQEMKRADWLLDLPKSAQCTFKSSSLNVPNLGVVEAGANRSLDGKSAAKTHEDHGTFFATYEWRCSSATALREIPLRVFNRFKRINSLAVRVAGDKSQFTVDIKRGRGDSTIPLNR